MDTIDFIASVEVPFHLAHFKEKKVYVFCSGTMFKGIRYWRLTTLNNLMLHDMDKGAAVDFKIDVHRIGKNLPSLPAKKTAYAKKHIDRLANLGLVGIANYEPNVWYGESFFFPATDEAIKNYIQYMKKQKIPPALRGALFQWVMLKMIGKPLNNKGISFWLDDAWKGYLKFTETELTSIDTCVKENATETTDEYTTWLNDVHSGKTMGMAINSDMLVHALTPPRRARLWLHLHPTEWANELAIRKFAMKGWKSSKSATTKYYAKEVEAILLELRSDHAAFFANKKNLPTAVSDISIAKGLAAALYITKRLKSIEAAKRDGVIRTLSKRRRDEPMYANGFYSALQEARWDGRTTTYKTLPQLVASNFSDRALL